MNTKQHLLILLAIGIFAGTIASCAGDPRKNCNHPQHGAYMKEQQMKRTGF